MLFDKRDIAMPSDCSHRSVPAFRSSTSQDSKFTLMKSPAATVPNLLTPTPLRSLQSPRPEARLLHGPRSAIPSAHGVKLNMYRAMP